LSTLVLPQKKLDMSKDPNFSGQPIFRQLLNFINKKKIYRLAQSKQSDRYYKRFDTYHHLVTMLYCMFHDCTSLREVTTGMQACYLRLKHLGINYCPRRSTLSDANKNRNVEVFEAIHKYLYKKNRRILSDSPSLKKWESQLFIVDSTTISLFKDILKNAGNNPINGKRKGGIKVHTLIKADEDVPCLINMNAAASHDTPFIQNMKLTKGSIVVFDKAYVDYNQYNKWTNEQVTWVTRMRKGTKYRTVLKAKILPQVLDIGILMDNKIILGHNHNKKKAKVNARLVVYLDKSTNKEFSFITNNLELHAIDIANIYKRRWQIELLFKRFKQSYPLQSFLGDNVNAIKIQIWTSLIADLILQCIRTKLKRKMSHSGVASLIRIHLMTYIDLVRFLNNPEASLLMQYPRGPTLKLF
jgi:hypothetical protein